MDFVVIVAWMFWIAVGIGLLVLFFKLIDYIIAGVIGLILAPFVISNLKKTNLHYFDHADRYFDYDKGQWIWKEQVDNA